MAAQHSWRRSPREWITFATIGLLAGVLSGFFGIGGGTIVVPALVLAAGFGQRLAAGTSLTAILPPAVAGILGYLPSGSVDWVAGGLLAVGAILGAQLGSYLLSRVPAAFLRWFFVAFLAVVAVQLFFTVPNREATLTIDLLLGAILVGVGFITGIIAGLIGVGGGIIIVPVLILFFGASDLVAKGTSLLMMIPTTLSGTVANYRNGNVDIPAAVVIGAFAAATSYLGVLLAIITPAQLASILFGCYVLFLLIRMAWNALKPKTDD